MRDISAGLEILAKADVNRDIDDAAAKLRTLQEQVAPRVRELREMDDWRRFANAQRQEQLIAMAEAIVASLKAEAEAGKDSDLAATARALRELHAKWHEVAEAPRHSAQRLWDRFRTATDFIRSRCEAVLRADARRARHQPAEESRGGRGSRSARHVERLGARRRRGSRSCRTLWQQVGPVPRDAARDLGQRFRTASNAFFARRREDLAGRKKAWADNLARKEALCARAEALAESTEWEVASAEMKRLQSSGRRSARCAATSRKSSGRGSAPPPTSSSSATTTATRSRSPASSPSAKRWSSSSRRSRPAARPRRPRSAGARAAAAHDVEPQRADSRAARSGRWPIAGSPRSRTSSKRAGRGVPGHRSGSGRHPPQDGEAGREGRIAARRLERDVAPACPRPSFSRRDCVRRWRATPWADARATNRSGAPPPTPSRKRRRHGSGSDRSRDRKRVRSKVVSARRAGA